MGISFSCNFPAIVSRCKLRPIGAVPCRAVPCGAVLCCAVRCRASMLDLSFFMSVDTTAVHNIYEVLDTS